MKRILTALMLLPLSAHAMQPSCKAEISVVSALTGKQVIETTATIYLNKEYSAQFNVSSLNGRDESDKIRVDLLLLAVEGESVVVRSTIEEDSGARWGGTSLTRRFPMNEPQSDSMSELYEIHWTFLAVQEEQS